MNIKNTDQWKAVAGLSITSKLGCYSYSIPAKNCVAGGKLFNVKNSVCSHCYARKGRYLFGNVKKALDRRFQSLVDPNWVDNMVFLITTAGQSYFRWHDSGDIQGAWHLNKIVDVAKRCPEVKFWLPTKERLMIDEWKLGHGEFPDNLCVRLSAPIKEFRMHPKYGPSSMVVKDPVKNNTPFTLCKSYQNSGKCGECRSCWDRDIQVIAYKEH